MAEIVRRRSWGGVLPLGRHVSISGSSLIQCASASIALSSFQDGQNAIPVQRFKVEQALAPTPAKAARLREATLARLLQEHRIRRLDAERVLSLLRQPAITVAEGVTEAAVLHLHSLVARLRLANREFHQAERKLDELCTVLRESTAASGGV